MSERSVRIMKKTKVLFALVFIVVCALFFSIFIYLDANMITMGDSVEKVVSVAASGSIAQVVLQQRHMTDLFGALLFMIIIILWSGSMLHRSNMKSPERIILLNEFTLLGWILLHQCNFYLFESMTLLRYSWYFNFFFIFMLPLLFLWLVLCIDTPEKEHPPGIWWVFILINLFLFAFVLTNDYHMLVFRFDSLDDWSSYYHYGPGYTFICIFTLLMIAVCMVYLLVRYKKSAGKAFIMQPLLMLVLIIAYTVGYSVHISLIQELDFVFVASVLVMFFYESCLRSGLIPNNTKYEELFARSPLQMKIIDRTGQLVLAASGVKRLPDEMRQKIINNTATSLPLDENILVSAAPIRGGYVIWQADIGAINRLQKESEDSIARLKAVNAMLKKKGECEGRLAALEARTMLFYKLEEEINEKLKEMSAMIRTFPKDDTAPRAAANLALLACYIKRRCNLFFWEEEARTMEADELAIYLDELAEFGHYAGIKAVNSCNLKGLVDVRCSTLIYDFYHAVLVWALKNNCRTLLAQILEENGKLMLKLMLSVKDLVFHPEPALFTAISAAGGTVTTKDLDMATSISLDFPKGGADDD